LQVKPQVPPLQVALASEGGVQGASQAPQFCGSVSVLTHWPLQFVSVPQSTVHVPLAHTCPVVQAVLQLPQYCGFVWVFTQLPPHLVSVPVHVKSQLPELQTAVPPVGAEQVVPHSPQLVTSLWMFLHTPPQSL